MAEHPHSAEAEGELEVEEWLAAEARERRFVAELQRLKRRARQKPIALLLVTLVGTALVVKKFAGRAPMYQASVIMRATESNVVNEQSPLAYEGLANYLWSVALSNERLLEIVDKYQLYSGLRSLGDEFAVGELRNVLDIKVSSNYFGMARDDGDALRSVVITLHFSDFDNELAFQVANSLSQVLIEAEQGLRNQHARMLEGIASTAVRKGEARLAKFEEELAEALLVIESERGKNKNKANNEKLARAQIDRLRLEKQIKQAAFVLEGLNADRDQLRLAKAAEEAQLALRFEVVDVRKPPRKPKPTKVQLAILATFVFFFLLPLVAIGLGALDSRLHHIEDLMRLGLPVVGRVSAFPNHNLGALRDRGRSRKDVA